MSTEKLNKEFAEWNPMEGDYKSVEFNKYNTGPGAGIDSELQPGRRANNRTNDVPTPYLMFQNVPKTMTKSALRLLCSRHGQVTDVRDSKKNDYFFMDLATVADMEAVYRALEHNNYGFRVMVGKQKNKTPTDLERNRGDQKISPVPPRSLGIDYTSRTYRTSNKQHPRPKLQDNSPFKSDENSNLKVLADDVHSLEREGLYKVKSNNKFNYHNGRSYVKMPEKTKDFIDKKNSESSGRYNISNDSYANTTDECKKPPKISRCSQCERECDTICSRCSVYYCSVQCQKNDWQQHRYICGKPKHLQRVPPPKESSKNKNMAIPSTSSTSPPKNINKAPPSEEHEYKQQIPRSGNIVTITAISKTNVVFIRSKTYEDNMSYFKTRDALQAFAKKLKPLPTMPKCGQVVIAKFENQFNRAIVLNINNKDQIFVNYMDYGNLDNLQLGDLYEAPQEFIDKPRHAIPVMLKDVPDCYMTEEIRKYMYTYLNNISVYMKYKPEDFNESNHVYAVELINETTEQILNKIIIELAKPQEPRTTEEICTIDFLERKLLPTNENQKFIVMDNSLMISGCISCTTIPFALEIQKFQKELQSYVESLPKIGYAPRGDELCVAKYSEDGLWYRGRCLEVVGDGHPSILFIDYGNIAIIPIDDVRRYPRQFTYPIYTADCEIHGLPESCDDKIVAKLEELIPNGSIIECKNVTTASVEDHFYSISLPNVISELTSCGLI